MSSQYISQFAFQLSKLSTRFHEEHELVVKALDNQVATLSDEVESLNARLLKTQEVNGYDSISHQETRGPSRDCSPGSRDGSPGREYSPKRPGRRSAWHTECVQRTMIGGQSLPRSVGPHTASLGYRRFDPLSQNGLSSLRESSESAYERHSSTETASRTSTISRVRITTADADDGEIASDGDEFSYHAYRESMSMASFKERAPSEKSWTVLGSEDFFNSSAVPASLVGGVTGVRRGSHLSSEESFNQRSMESFHRTNSKTISSATSPVQVNVADERSGRFTNTSDNTGGMSRRVANKFSIDEVFPAWFNPFVQETYVGKREGKERASHQIVEAIRLQSDFNLDLIAKRRNCVLRPLGQSVMVWTMFWVVALTYDLWVTPLESAFIDEDRMPSVYKTLNYAVLGFFCVDIVLNFFMGYLDGEIEIVDHWKIAQAYLKGWFIIDVMATMPWNLIFDIGRGVSSSRAAKAFKAMKVVKTLRILKIYKYNRIIRQAKHIKYARAVSKAWSKREHSLSRSRIESLYEELQKVETYFRPLVLPTKATLVTIILAHAHTAFYALSNGWTPSSDVGLGFERYYQSMRWYFCLLTFGSSTTLESDLSDNAVLELIVLVERLILVTFMLSRITFGTLVLQQEEAKIQMKYANTMDYLRQHDVSARTRAQVRFNVKETSKHRAVQQHFLDLCRDNLPEHLQSQICKELWAKHLVTFGLFNEISKWTEEFIGELCMIVTEKTYASKVVVFQENDAVHEALMILKGRLTVKSSFQNAPIPPFSDGMWIGEKGLINMGLRRSGTCVTEVMSNVMAVPVYGFQLLLDRLGVLNRFQEFCCNELWRGLCGRCGKMSDHFSNTCPTVCGKSTSHYAAGKSKHMGQWYSTNTARFGSISLGPLSTLTRGATMSLGIRSSVHGSAGSAGARLSEGGSTESTTVQSLDMARLAHDTKLFLIFHGLQTIAPDLQRNGVVTLDDLSAFFATRKQDYAPIAALDLPGPEAIRAFREEMANETKRMLSLRMSQHDYFVFVSHFKVEAGTEAALIRAELTQLIDEDEGHPAKDLHTAIFLDAEDLKDLGILLKAVTKSHNMILLLTPGVLTRPWCLMEIAAAVRANVNLLPVLITKPGCEFIFPDEKFYSEFLAGATVGQAGVSEVEKQGFEMAEICKALRKIFDTIAMSYSPHRTASIRNAECKSILSRCTCRAINKESVQGRMPTRISRIRDIDGMQSMMPTPMHDPRFNRDPRAHSQIGIDHRRNSTASVWAMTNSMPSPSPRVMSSSSLFSSPRNRI